MGGGGDMELKVLKKKKNKKKKKIHIKQNIANVNIKITKIQNTRNSKRSHELIIRSKNSEELVTDDACTTAV
jgi:hypothetical protein